MEMQGEAPNLDAMPPSELLEFTVRHRFDVDAALLVEYAAIKYVAMKHRALGDIDFATGLEEALDFLYEDLPPHQKW